MKEFWNGISGCFTVKKNRICFFTVCKLFTSSVLKRFSRRPKWIIPLQTGLCSSSLLQLPLCSPEGRRKGAEGGAGGRCSARSQVCIIIIVITITITVTIIIIPVLTLAQVWAHHSSELLENLTVYNKSWAGQSPSCSCVSLQSRTEAELTIRSEKAAGRVWWRGWEGRGNNCTS